MAKMHFAKSLIIIQLVIALTVISAIHLYGVIHHQVRSNESLLLNPQINALQFFKYVTNQSEILVRLLHVVHLVNAEPLTIMPSVLA